MPSPQAEQAIEEKMDRIEEILEEFVLDAIISVLIKVCDRNQLFANLHRRKTCYRTDCYQRDDIPF